MRARGARRKLPMRVEVLFDRQKSNPPYSFTLSMPVCYVTITLTRSRKKYFSLLQFPIFPTFHTHSHFAQHYRFKVPRSDLNDNWKKFERRMPHVVVLYSISTLFFLTHLSCVLTCCFHRRRLANQMHAFALLSHWCVYVVAAAADVDVQKSKWEWEREYMKISPNALQKKIILWAYIEYDFIKFSVKF